MNKDQLSFAIKHFNELQPSNGMFLKDLKPFGMRPYVERIQRRRNGKMVSLYCLTEENIQCVQENMNFNDNSAEETFEQEMNPEDYLVKLGSNDYSVPNSSSSILLEYSSMNNEPENKLVTQICRGIVHGKCHLTDIFNRVLLIRIYFKRLCNEGLTSTEIVTNDLLGMLRGQLKMNKDNRYTLKPESRLEIENIIYEFYKKDAYEYLNFTKRIYEKKGIYRSSIIQEINHERNLYTLKSLIPKMEKFRRSIKSLENDGIMKNNKDERERIERIITKIGTIELNFKDKCGFTLEQLDNFICMTKLSTKKIMEIKENFTFLMKQIKELPELSASELDFFNVNEEWKSKSSEASKKIELPSGEDNIVEMLKISDGIKDLYSREIGHPFNFDLNIISCLFLVISKEAQRENLKYLTDDEIFEKLSYVDHNEANKTVSKYLELKAIETMK